jgi:hypothetical protein
MSRGQKFQILPKEVIANSPLTNSKKLTEAGRASNCRRFLTTISQLLNSLTLWASNDGTGIRLSDSALAAETRFLKLRLMTLEKSLEKAVKDCLKDMNEALAEHIFENYPELVELAVSEANNTVSLIIPFICQFCSRSHISHGSRKLPPKPMLISRTGRKLAPPSQPR